MPRYFLEVAYKGTNYSGFQVQENANTIQAEITKAFRTIHRTEVQLTGSSRTDAGVHAYQNYFHFDFEENIHPQFVYKMNALMPYDIAVKNLYKVNEEAHSRFDAQSREYIYRIHRFKNPFNEHTSFYYPYKLDLKKMEDGASLIKEQTNFTAFSKTNTQVKNYNCRILESRWLIYEEEMIYHIQANRFLRGMVRSLTAVLLKLGREKIAMNELEGYFREPVKCPYSAPAHGLYLKSVHYPENFFSLSGMGFTSF
jgi:tRNA pseudouridine38-40 synthase